MNLSESGTNTAVTTKATVDLLAEENEVIGETLTLLNVALLESEKRIAQLEAEKNILLEYGTTLRKAAQDTIDQGYPTQKLYDALSAD